MIAFSKARFLWFFVNVSATSRTLKHNFSDYSVPITVEFHRMYFVRVYAIFPRLISQLVLLIRFYNVRSVVKLSENETVKICLFSYSFCSFFPFIHFIHSLFVILNLYVTTLMPIVLKSGT